MPSQKTIFRILIFVIAALPLTGCQNTDLKDQITQDIDGIKTTINVLDSKLDHSNVRLEKQLSEIDIQIGELQKQINDIETRKTFEITTVENIQNDLDIEKIFKMICDPKTIENLTKKIESSESNVEGGQQMLFLINLICG